MSTNIPYREVVETMVARKTEIIWQRLLPQGAGPPRANCPWVWMPIDKDFSFDRETYFHPAFGPHRQSTNVFAVRRESIRRVCPIFEIERTANGVVLSETESGFRVSNGVWELEEAGLEFFVSSHGGKSSTFIFLSENDAVLGAAALCSRKFFP